MQTIEENSSPPTEPEQKPPDSPEPPEPPEPPAPSVEEEPIPEALTKLTEESPKAKQKPGRPKGSKDTKPRARQAKVKTVAVVEPEEAVQPVNELPRALPQSRPIPTHAYNDHAALMLNMLAHQAKERQNRKAHLWKSWFQ